MGINMNNKVSFDDREAVRDSLNTPSMEPGFESDDANSDAFSDIDIEWDDPSDIFSDDTDWGDSKGSSDDGDDIWGKNDSLSDTKWDGDSNWDEKNKKSDDALSKAWEITEEATKQTFGVLKEIYPSLKNRTSDDLGYIGTLSIKTGAIAFCVGTVLGIIFKISGIGSVINLSLFTTVIAGILLVATGLVEIGLAAYLIEKHGVNGRLDNIDDIDNSDNGDGFFDETDDILISLEDDLFGDGGDLFGSNENEELSIDIDDEDNSSFGDLNIDDDKFSIDFSEEEKRADNEEISSEDILNSVNENGYICRETLLDTFSKVLPLKTPEFGDEREISTDSEEYITIDTICIKAVANVLDCGIEEVGSHVESITETYFCYIIRMKRVRRLNKIDALAREIEVYMREDSSDLSVNADVEIEGDFYKITVSKGVSPIVTLGDMIKQEKTYEYFKDEGHKLPIILGIDQNGKLELDDAKFFNTMMIAGKQRSGKSWYLLSLLMCMMLFNTPEDVMFCIIDPKDSNLFKTISLMPHVFGLHDWEDTLKVMDDLINVEAERRKKLFVDNKCDDIWALREKGIRLPIIYLCVDEYMTIRNSLGDAVKDLNLKLQIIISQLPSLGIGIIFVPHRAAGIVDKTNRTLVQLTAAVRLDTSTVCEVLDTKKWDRALVNQGDIGLKTCNMQVPKYVRGLALTESDTKNTEFIETAAKVFYKMGVDIPDMSHLGTACNRDSEYVRKTLYSSGEREQYSYKNVFNDL